MDDHRFETARLAAEALLKHHGDSPQLLWQLYHAHRGLADPRAAMGVLQRLSAETDDERLTLHLRRAEDWYRLGEYSFYRDSEESRAGLSGEEYEAKMRSLTRAEFDSAKSLARSDPQRRQLAQTLRQCKYVVEANNMLGDTAVEPEPPLKAETTATGSLRGALHFADGSPVVDAMVTLGLALEIIAPNPADYLRHDMGVELQIGPQTVLTCRTDSNGEYAFDFVPAGEQAFLSVTLDSDLFDIPTRFLAHGISIAAGEITRRGFTVTEWTSAPTQPIESPLPAVTVIDGRHYRQVHSESIRNPFHFDFPRQVITLPIPERTSADRLVLFASDAPNAPQPFQVIDGRATFFAGLGPRTEKTFALYEPFVSSAARSAALDGIAIAEEGDSLVIDTGRAQFRLPGSSAAIYAPPLIAVRGEDGIWRGRGRFRLPAGERVVARTTEVLDRGPLVSTIRVNYRLSGGAAYTITFTAHHQEAYLLAHEVSPAIDDAAFEFSLTEFSGGRGFLHWTPENGTAVHWTTLDRRDRELARLQESIAWWIPPCGFAYAMTAGRIDSRDYAGVFTIRRGDWIDRKFGRIAQGPGDDNRELDWPYPEMIGSTISMITAHTDASGDAFFRFGLFDGERRWGILVSTLDRNDGPYKELSAVQHKNSSPRLEDFKRWRLDEQDQIVRPFVVAQRGDLKLLRKKKDVPRFAKLWGRITAPNAGGAAAGLRFAIEGDPVIAWRKKLEILYAAQIRSRMVLLGRDFSDMYSPVGARPITPWVEEYDLIAASGVFTPDEERLVRQFFMLMGHMHMEPDFMNWKFNSRNANFEADRTDVVGAIGLAFHGNPDAKTFVDHAAELMEKSINIYCTPGSGKWYENPSCYYLHAAKCRMNLAFHLASHGIMDPTRIPRLKDFLRWGVLLLMPTTPHRYEIMRDGTADEATYRATNKVRRIVPIGDHAHIGPWVPEHYALLSKLYRPTDPAFAELLLWAWQSGGEDGAYFGNAPLVFAKLDEANLALASPQSLESRRLEGFGAVFRGNFGLDDEFFLLFKQGPGGYRYHRTEGSLILFANGQPLIYDGGEAGETWRHSTLSFHDTHTPLAAGHVERFASLPALDFCQGVHPVALKPGEPTFLSDKCDHQLVDLAYTCFAEPNPADSRSVWWIKDDYVIVHDELRLEPGTLSHWHLQVVSDHSTGSAELGYRFIGRYGTDLQVLLADQSFAAESVEQTPLFDYRRPPAETFSMRHLQLSATSPDHYLAVLRPLFGKKKPIQAASIRNGNAVYGIHVRGDGLDDQLFFSRQPITHQGDGLSFDGRYGAILSRTNSRTLILIDGHHLEWNGIRIESTGGSIELQICQNQASLTLNGTNWVRLFGYGPTQEWKLGGENKRIRLTR